jgi:CheY-like chemotaxis protein
LIVDDDPAVVESLCDALGDEGYMVATAPDGLRAIDHLRASPPPCVILLDWMMPGCDGPCFRRKQKADPSLADIPVILLTADVRLRDRARDLDVFAQLSKPVALDELLAAIEQACGSRKVIPARPA